MANVVPNQPKIAENPTHPDGWEWSRLAQKKHVQSISAGTGWYSAENDEEPQNMCKIWAKICEMRASGPRKKCNLYPGLMWCSMGMIVWCAPDWQFMVLYGMEGCGVVAWKGGKCSKALADRQRTLCKAGRNRSPSSS